jgi:hypothetical protein
LEAKAGPEIFDEVYASAFASVGADVSLPNLVFPGGKTEDPHPQYTFNHSYNFNSSYGFAPNKYAENTADRSR